jgi:hypothetical protein
MKNFKFRYLTLYDKRCKCNEEISSTKTRKSVSRSEGKPIQYPESNEIKSKTFQIKYEKKLSSTAKFILNSFQNKYIYYAMDDILYLLELNSFEREDLLTILYSPVLSLQNNFSVNFFDIWIHDIYIDEISKVNRFLNKNSKIPEQFNYITIKLFYKIKVPIKKQESLW